MSEQQMNGKAIKFRTLAERRVSKVLQRVRGLGNLSRRTSYDYSPDQVTKMFAAIRSELDQVEQKFAPENKAQRSFTFD